MFDTMSDGIKEQITRSLFLPVYGNSLKLESARYNAFRFTKYVQHFLTQLFYHKWIRFFSTKGMGQLANQAQHKAIGMLNAQKKANQAKQNCPQVHFTVCPAIIEVSQKSKFDYWISYEDSFSKKRIRIPAKSHKRLNHFLKKKWKLNPNCELVLQKNGRWQARVFVQTEVEKAKPKENSLGVDVGLNHCVSRSDGYLGVSAKKILKKAKLKDAERRRQGHQRSLPKTSLIQQLDREAQRAVHVAKELGWNLIVESRKVLANLKLPLQWARAYFSKRCHILGQEQGVFVWEVHPAYTSSTCYKCDYRRKESRVKSRFKCLGCGNSTHADINAGRVIARTGTEIIRLRYQKAFVQP